MDWTSFALGGAAGSLLIDIMWRILMRATNTLVGVQRDYITELEDTLEIYR